MFKAISNTTHSQLTDWGLLILRISVGVLMITHGLPKLTGFNQIVADGNFIPVLGSIWLGLALTVMAEFFMSLFLITGLLTRISVVPLIVTMLVAVFVAHANDPLSVKEHALLFLFPYITLLLAGPGRFSADYFLAGNHKKS
ncbi:MAG: DoxX family protein [Lentimicrobium sp.]